LEENGCEENDFYNIVLDTERYFDKIIIMQIENKKII
jgi:hypothetical protein